MHLSNGKLHSIVNRRRTMNEHTIDFARDFTNRPFGRYRSDGEHSGEAFRDDILAPALRQHDHVTLDLGSANLYGSSFLEEVFGGLVREGFTKNELDRKLTVLHDRLPSYVLEAEEYIQRADKVCV